MILPVNGPWWAYLVAVLAGPLVYICRQLVVWRLGSKAIDKADPDRVSEVINAVTGYKGMREPRRSPLEKK
jgi:hypothetical protein